MNIIARPNHDVWSIQDPETLRQWFQNAFPRMNFNKEEDGGILPKKEWERFVKEEGTAFPFCQYTNGVTLCSVDREYAVILIGDALHSHPPDIGQGINAGLLDVVALGEALENVNLSVMKNGNNDVDDSGVGVGKESLGDAMKSFEVNRLGEVR